MAALYRYEPMRKGREIRILELFEGLSQSPLQGRMHHVMLDSHEHFEALSYVWGSDAKPHVLKTTEGDIQITASLYSALQQVRQSSGSRMIWADAVCINQEDGTEKRKQVRLMGQIYNQAQRVLAYLGDDGGDGAIAFSLLELMGSEAMKDDGEAGQAARETIRGKDLRPVAALMRRPWFCRAWIIQEFVNAKDVIMMVGPGELHWKVLFNAIDNTYSYEGWSLQRSEDTAEDRKLTARAAIALATLEIARDKTSTSLLDLFDLMQDKDATRRRDHLFSLLSLAHDAEDPAFDPDYDEPLDAVVRRYAAVFIQRGDTFHLLGTAGLSSGAARFPSWIPDWTSKRPYRYPNGLVDDDAIYNAGGKDGIMAQFDQQADELVIKGCDIDEVSFIVSRSSDKESGQWTRNYLLQFDEAISCCGSLPYSENPFDVQWRTLIGDRDYGGQVLEKDEGELMRLSYAALRKRLQLPVPESLEDAPPDSDSFEFIHQGLALRYRLALTKHGYMCLVPNEAKLGDVVCVFTGCSLPFIIRRNQLRQGTAFQLIGKCYVHGFMDGEAFLKEKFDIQEFRLH